MTIVSVTPYLIPGDPRPSDWCARKPYVFVRVETDSGVVGWGEAYTFTHRETALLSLIHSLGARLVGKELSSIQAFRHDTVHGFGEQRIGIDVFSAASGIELALWDALGRSLDVPVYKLIGGPCRESIDVYANLWTNHPVTTNDLVARAVKQVEIGFQAIKFYPFSNVASDREGIDRIARMRDALGPNVAVAIDLSRRMSPDRARDLCHRLEPFDLAWVEDPFAPTNPAALRQLRDQVRSPLMTGETLAGKDAFRSLFEHQSVSLINPDICACGGLLELREIAAMAESAFVTVSPHNYNSMTIGFAASLHAAAGMPNAGPTEYFPELANELDPVCEGQLRPVNGRVPLPNQPGFGPSFNDAKMAPYRVTP